MLNPFKEVNWQPDIVARRAFAKSLVIGFPCVALVLLLGGWLVGRGWNWPFTLRLGGIGAAAGVVFFAVPSTAKPFYIVWYALACCVGLVVSNVVLGLVFYLVVTGIGLFRRLCCKQSIRKGLDAASSTYWQTAPSAPNPERYFSQF